MSKPIIAAARQVRGSLHYQEDQIDGALAGQAQLLKDLVDARRETGVSARFGGSIVDQAIAAVTQLGDARRTVLALHAELAGTNIRSIGDTVDCPDELAGSPFRGVSDEETRTAA